MVFKGKYFFLSNFSECVIKVKIKGKDLRFNSVETAFQAHKNFDLAKNFVLLQPLEAKKLGTQIKITTPDWETYKVYLMGRLLIQKFRTPDLFFKLKAVKDPVIVEDNYWGDTYWGKCNGKGKNILGKLLTHIRDNNCNQKLLDEYIKNTLLKE